MILQIPAYHLLPLPLLPLLLLYVSPFPK
jgi:hypothetical protein